MLLGPPHRAHDWLLLSLLSLPLRFLLFLTSSVISVDSSDGFRMLFFTTLYFAFPCLPLELMLSHNVTYPYLAFLSRDATRHILSS